MRRIWIALCAVVLVLSTSAGWLYVRAQPAPPSAPLPPEAIAQLPTEPEGDVQTYAEDARLLGGTIVGGTIYTSTTWTTAASPYLVTSNISIAAGGTLTIQAGVAVKFQPNMSMSVQGVLIPQGSAASPVVFTSYRDDTYGGDSNGDGSATVPAPGDWTGIYVYNSANDLHHLVVRYPCFCLSINSCSPTVRDSMFEAWYWRTGDGAIVSSGSGMTPARPQILNNTFIGRFSFPFYQQNYSFPSYGGNDLTRSQYKGIRVGGTIASDDARTETWSDCGIPRIVDSLTIGSRVTLNLSPGVVIKFVDARSLYVDGVLRSQGTAAAPVVFTSEHDDSVGGDSDADFGGGLPRAGNWGSIWLRGNGSFLAYTRIRYGGSGTFSGVMTENVSCTIRNCLFEDNANYALLLKRSGALCDIDVEYNTFRGNANGIRVQ